MTLPLLAAQSLDDLITFADDRGISARELAAKAELVAAALPARSHAINLVENRCLFLIGWVAACLRGQVTLLPPSQSAATLAEIRRDYPDHHVLDDAGLAELANRPVPPLQALGPAWQIPGERIVAIAFTSGSTGQPQAHPKSWGSLFHNSRFAAEDVLGGPRISVVATVPAQHMYGLEASAIGALSAGCLIHDRKPFFPADVRDALQTLPAPRVLVTTPAHLKVLAASDVHMPALHRVVSATAPLDTALAARVEAAWHTQLFEIYGCTEAGVMAHRHTTAGEVWRTLRGGSIVQANGVAEYRAPQLVAPAPLQDVIESRDDTEFVLRGRVGDMIKVAGKRASLQELTRQVLSVPGVEDAVVFVPADDARPAALVVAPRLTRDAVLEALRQRMEPVFVPRPLQLMTSLPRNAVGKLPREQLLELLRGASA